MKDGQVKVITAAVDNRRRRIIYLVPIFLGAVAIGFLLELSTYESLNFAEIKVALANLPHRWNRIPAAPPQYQNPPPPFDENPNENNGGLQEQKENETVIYEKVPELWAQPNLLNLPTFSWLLNNESLCQLEPRSTENTRLMPILVHTARSNFAERLAIRKSWGSIPIYKKWDIRFVFLLGEADRGSNPEVNQKQFEEQETKLKEEQKLFGDIVIGSFIDTYHNLTYKHMMGYKWILNYCTNATFVMKIDDDMFIDIMRWLDWRSADFEKVAANSSAVIPDLYCHTFAGTKPMRERGSKWYASKEDWPGEWYPDYCSGWAYAITVSLMRKLYSVSNAIKFFWIDDVYATGALMEELKKQLKWKPEIFHIWGNVTGEIKEYRPMCESGSFDSKREFRAVVYVPRGGLFERDMMCMWNKTLHDSTYNFTAST